MTRDVNGYPCEPRDVREGVWFYEQKEGLMLCVAGLNNGISFGTTTITAPWHKVCAAVDRHRKVKTKG